MYIHMAADQNLVSKVLSFRPRCATGYATYIYMYPKSVFQNLIHCYAALHAQHRKS